MSAFDAATGFGNRVVVGNRHPGGLGFPLYRGAKKARDKSAATKSAHRQTALLVAPFESSLAPCVGCQDHQRRGTRQIRRLALT